MRERGVGVSAQPPVEQPHVDSGAYALGALDAEERAAFEEHMRTCAACREETADFEHLARRLRTEPDIAPPAALRARVLEGAAGERGGRGPRSAPVRRVLLFAAAAALVLLAVVVVRVATPDPLEDVLAADDAQRVALQGEGVRDGRVVVSDDLGDAVLQVELDPLGEPQVYAVWRIDEQGDPEALRTLEPDADGQPLSVLLTDAIGGRAVALSVETPPIGDAPRGPIVAEAPLP